MLLEMTAADLPDVAVIDYGARLEEELSRPWAKAWIVRERGVTLVAVLSVWVVFDEMQILHIATHPDARRKGHARVLLNHAVSCAKALFVNALFLEVRASNCAARLLYESTGFTIARTRPGYYSDGEDGLEMRLSVHHESVRSGPQS